MVMRAEAGAVPKSCFGRGCLGSADQDAMQTKPRRTEQNEPTELSNETNPRRPDRSERGRLLHKTNPRDPARHETKPRRGEQNEPVEISNKTNPRPLPKTNPRDLAPHKTKPPIGDSLRKATAVRQNEATDAGLAQQSHGRPTKRSHRWGLCSERSHGHPTKRSHRLATRVEGSQWSFDRTKPPNGVARVGEACTEPSAAAKVAEVSRFEDAALAVMAASVLPVEAPTASG